jgi:hypothetical protein
MATADRGSTWSGQALPSGLHQLNVVSCPTTTDCWAAGGTTEGGAGIISSSPTIKSFSPTSGSPGTVVSLKGINLSNAIGVRFNGTPAETTSDSKTKLVTSVPTGASSGEITVTTPFGQAMSGTNFSDT